MYGTDKPRFDACFVYLEFESTPDHLRMSRPYQRLYVYSHDNATFLRSCYLCLKTGVIVENGSTERRRISIASVAGK